jgi:hypothetical protein
LFQAPGASWSRLRIDQKSVPETGIELSQGMHTVDIEAGFEASRGVTFLWKRRAASAWQVLPGVNVSPQPRVHGLTGSYFPTADWTGTPYLKRVDPFMSLLGADFPLSAPFSVRWEGTLQAPKTGGYLFGALNNQFSWIYVDGKLVVANTTADGYQEAPVRLTAGRHTLRVDYQKKEGSYPTLILYWTPPGEGKQKIPFSALEP